MTWPRWFRRAVRNRHRHAEQVSRRWRGGRRGDSGRTRRKFDFHSGGKLVAGKKLYHPVKCVADAKLGALARGMAQGHNSMETMSAPRQDMLVGALEGFLEDLGQ